MATTKIWAIKDSLSRVVNYAKNPEKTIFSDLKQVLKYAENYEKTTDKNEKTIRWKEKYLSNELKNRVLGGK